MRAIPECLRGVITTRRYTNPRLFYLTLPYINVWNILRNISYDVLRYLPIPLAKRFWQHTVPYLTRRNG